MFTAKFFPMKTKYEVSIDQVISFAVACIFGGLVIGLAVETNFHIIVKRQSTQTDPYSPMFFDTKISYHQAIEDTIKAHAESGSNPMDPQPKFKKNNNLAER
jgi:hypothetical protein